MIPVLLALVLSLSTNLDGERVDLRCEIGDAYFRQGLLEQAESEFREALRLDSSCAKAMLGLGRVYRAREAWEQAEIFLRRYTDSYPSDPAGLLELSGLLMETCRVGEASELALRAAENSDADGAAWLMAGRAGLACDDTTSAVRSLGRALALGGRPSLEASVLLAEISLRSGETAEALELLDWGVGQGHAPSCFRLGVLYVTWGDLVRGSSLLRQSLAISPTGSFSDSAHIVLDGLASSGFFNDTPEMVEN